AALPGTDDLDAVHHLGPQVGRHLVLAAAAFDELLDLLLKAVLLQARRALLEVLLVLGGVALGHLTVQVLVEVVEDLRAVRLVRLSATHEPEPFRSCDPSDGAPAGARPRSRA